LQRQPEVVVEVAFGFEDAKLCAERGRDSFLGSSFSGRSGDGDNAAAPLAAHMVGQGLHGGEWVFCNQERMGERGVGQGSDARARDDRAHGPALESCGNKVVAVEAFAAHSKKEIAGSDGARVNRVAGRDGCACIGHAGRGFEHRTGAHCHFCKREVHCPTP